MGGPSASPSLTASAAGPISMAMPLNMSTGQLVDRRGEPSSSPLSSAKPDSHWAMVSMQTRSSCWP
ncbi:Uncharacterised protein [Bordetella pertussis]|nr:Uncharacterised protein [Bordetella pertussis]